MARIQNLPDASPRIVVVDGEKLGIRTYGEDNGYPQRMLNLINASVSAKMCSNICAKYIIGKGFEDQEFYKAIINQTTGLTPDKLLNLLSHDKSKFRGVAVHINYNALYQKESISFVPFENCRLGFGDNAGKIAVWDNWYSSLGKKRKTAQLEPDFLYRYNPNPEVIQQQVDEAGGWEFYKGQILWRSEDFGTYPLAFIDPALNDVQAEIESSNTRKNNLKNNFQLKTIWIEKGKAQDKREQEEAVDNISNFVGNDGKQVAVVFSETQNEQGVPMDAPELRSVQSVINDKLFEYTDKETRAAIYRVYNQPAILHSDYNGTNGYNEGQLPQSMAYYNSITEPDRIFMEELFTELFTNFSENINPTNTYKILSLEVVTGASDIDTSNIDNRSLVEIIGVGGVQALQAILADTNTTPEQKKNTLMIVFNLNEDDAGKLAGIDSGIVEEKEE